MIGLVAVTVISYVISSCVVGISYFTLFGNRIGLSYNRIAFVILLAVFAVLDLYWVPAIVPLDITFSIGNDEIAKAFDADSAIRLNDILSFGWFDVLVWLIQTTIGYFVGMKVYSRIIRAAQQPPVSDGTRRVL